LRISQEAELDLHSEVDMKNTDMILAGEFEFNSKPYTEFTAPALVCGAELKFEYGISDRKLDP
jgi:hypothetical protein